MRQRQFDVAADLAVWCGCLVWLWLFGVAVVAIVVLCCA